MAKTSDLRDDIGTAFEAVKNKFGIKNEVRHLSEYLEADEQVVAMSGGLIKGSGNGALVLTDRRVVFVFHGAVRKGMEEFRLGQITSVASKSGPMFAALTLTVAGAAKSVENVDKKDAERIVGAIRQAITSGSPAPGSRGDGQDVFAQIGKLKDLHDAGVLTDEEFAAKKTELLGRV